MFQSPDTLASAVRIGSPILLPSPSTSPTLVSGPPLPPPSSPLSSSLLLPLRGWTHRGHSCAVPTSPQPPHLPSPSPATNLPHSPPPPPYLRLHPANPAGASSSSSSSSSTSPPCLRRLLLAPTSSRPPRPLASVASSLHPLLLAAPLCLPAPSSSSSSSSSSTSSILPCHTQAKPVKATATATQEQSPLQRCFTALLLLLPPPSSSSSSFLPNSLFILTLHFEYHWLAVCISLLPSFPPTMLSNIAAITARRGVAALPATLGLRAFSSESAEFAFRSTPKSHCKPTATHLHPLPFHCFALPFPSSFPFLNHIHYPCLVMLCSALRYLRRPLFLSLSNAVIDYNPGEKTTATKDELMKYFEDMYVIRRMEIACDNEYKVRKRRDASPPQHGCSLLPPPTPSYPLLSPPIPSYPLLSPPIPSYPLLSPPANNNHLLIAIEPQHPRFPSPLRRPRSHCCGSPGRFGGR